MDCFKTDQKKVITYSMKLRASNEIEIPKLRLNSNTQKEDFLMYLNFLMVN